MATLIYARTLTEGFAGGQSYEYFHYAILEDNNTRMYYVDGRLEHMCSTIPEWD
jgi:hypothetical protein